MVNLKVVSIQSTWRCCVLVICLLSLTAGASTNQFWTYFGTWSGKTSKGIYMSRFDADTGTLSPPKLAASGSSLCFLAIRPDDESLISASDIQTNAKVEAFSINQKTGRLSHLNDLAYGNGGCCYVSYDHTGKYAFAASYFGAQIFAWQVKDDGRIGDQIANFHHQGSSVNPARQSSAHPHQIVIDPGNKFVFVCDLGLDKVMRYRFDAPGGSMAPGEPPFTLIKPGSGPRHIAFSPDGNFAYVVNEMGATVTAFAYTPADGGLRELGTYPTLPADYTNANTAAEVVVHPSGKFLYASNRGHDSIAIFHIDPASGLLTPAGHQSTLGHTPRFITIDPTGKYMFAANQNSDNVFLFQINDRDGSLIPTGQSIPVGAPGCIVFVPVAE